MERGGEGRHGNGMHDLVDSTTSAVGGFSHFALPIRHKISWRREQHKIPKDPGWVNHIFCIHLKLPWGRRYQIIASKRLLDLSSEGAYQSGSLWACVFFCLILLIYLNLYQVKSSQVKSSQAKPCQVQLIILRQ